MDERVKFLIAGFGLMLFAISPVFVGISTYNTAWENPEEPTLVEALLDYLNDAQYATTHPGFSPLLCAACPVDRMTLCHTDERYR